MVTLQQTLNAVALHGIVEPTQLSRQMQCPLPLLTAFLEQLVRMHKIERVEEPSSTCISGQCRHCPESQQCASVFYKAL